MQNQGECGEQGATGVPHEPDPVRPPGVPPHATYQRRERPELSAWVWGGPTFQSWLEQDTYMGPGGLRHSEDYKRGWDAALAAAEGVCVGLSVSLLGRKQMVAADKCAKAIRSLKATR